MSFKHHTQSYYKKNRTRSHNKSGSRRRRRRRVNQISRRRNLSRSSNNTRHRRGGGRYILGREHWKKMLECLKTSQSFKPFSQEENNLYQTLYRDHTRIPDKRFEQDRLLKQWGVARKSFVEYLMNREGYSLYDSYKYDRQPYELNKSESTYDKVVKMMTDETDIDNKFEFDETVQQTFEIVKRQTNPSYSRNLDNLKVFFKCNNQTNRTTMHTTFVQMVE